MNVAASTIILLGLLLPAIAFRRFYYTGEFSRQYVTEDFVRLVLRTSALACVLHLAAYVIVGWLYPGLRYGYGLAVEALLGDGKDVASTFGAWRGRTAFFTLYVTLIACGGLLGAASRYSIVSLGWDRSVKLFRFQNYWHYLLRGGIRDFTQVRDLLAGGRDSVSFTFVDVLVSSSEGDMLYDGMLVDYELKPDNQLEALILTDARRRPLRNDNPDREPQEPSVRAARFYRVVGDIFVVPAAQIKNYNLRYITHVRIGAAADAIIQISVNDADGDVSSATYFNQP